MSHNRLRGAFWIIVFSFVSGAAALAQSPAEPFTVAEQDIKDLKAVFATVRSMTASMHGYARREPSPP